MIGLYPPTSRRNATLCLVKLTWGNWLLFDWKIRMNHQIMQYWQSTHSFCLPKNSFTADHMLRGGDLMHISMRWPVLPCCLLIYLRKRRRHGSEASLSCRPPVCCLAFVLVREIVLLELLVSPVHFCCINWIYSFAVTDKEKVNQRWAETQQVFCLSY